MDKEIKKEDMEKIKEEIEKEKQLQDKDKKKSKPFRWPWAKRQVMNRSLKKPDQILVFLLNLKRQIEGPILTKIYGGNFLVIRNHVYRFNPDKVLSFGKYKSVIAREFDRELVGVDDYQELVLQDWTSRNPGARVNIDDPVLIKALIQAKLAEKPTLGGGKWWIIALVIVGVIAAFFLFTGKKTPVPTPAPTPAP